MSFMRPASSSYRLDRDRGEKNNLVTSPEFKITIDRLLDGAMRIRAKEIGEG
jgi:hypothetical protein